MSSRPKYRQHLVGLFSVALVASLLPLVVPSGVPAQASTPQPCATKFEPEEPKPNDQGIRVVNSPAELVWLTESQDPGAPWFDSHIVLANDIDLEGCLWSPIYQPGRDANPRTELEAITPGFIGTFDGNGHTISGLTLSSPSGDRSDGFGKVEEEDEILLGFFALINSPGEVRDVSFESPVVVLNNVFFANDGNGLDGIGIVAGAVGQDSDSTSASRFDNITITEGNMSLECTSPNGCVVQNVGGLAGRLAHADASDITVDMTFSLLDGAEEDLPAGELDRRLTLPPGGARLSTVGLLAGSASNVSASRITTTGTIQSEVSANTVGGIAGQWRAGSTLSQSRADVAIQVGGGSRNVTPQLDSVAGLGGIFGSLSGSESAVSETAATGLIDIQLAAYATATPGKETIVSRIGGFVGGAFGDGEGGPSLSDILVSTEVTVSVFNPDNAPTVDVFGLGGVLGMVGATHPGQEGQRADENPPPQVTRGLAIGGVDLAAIPEPTVPEDVNAFIGRVATTKNPSVSDSYWATAQYESLDDSFAQGKSGDALRSLSTYTNWSIAPSWNSGETAWGICQQPEPSLPFLQWMTEANPCAEDTTVTNPPPPDPPLVDSPVAESPVGDSGSETRKARETLEVFSVGPIQLSFSGRVGDAVIGTTASASGASMLPESVVRKEVRSTPTLLSSVAVRSTGDFVVSGTLPQLPPGNHRLIIAGLDNTGTAWTVTLPFGVDSDGRFSQIGQPAFSYGAALAATGPAISPLMLGAFAGALIVFGFGLLTATRIWVLHKTFSGR